MPIGGRSFPATFLQEERFPWPFRMLGDMVLGVELGEMRTLGQGCLNLVSQGQPWGAPELGRASGVRLVGSCGHGLHSPFPGPTQLLVWGSGES